MLDQEFKYFRTSTKKRTNAYKKYRISLSQHILACWCLSFQCTSTLCQLKYDAIIGQAKKRRIHEWSAAEGPPKPPIWEIEDCRVCPDVAFWDSTHFFAVALAAVAPERRRLGIGSALFALSLPSWVETVLCGNLANYQYWLHVLKAILELV